MTLPLLTGDWIDITIENGSLELLALGEGDLEALLATEEVTTGKYTQLRVIIDTIGVTLEPVGDPPVSPEPPEIVLPSGELKFVGPFEVTEGGTTILLLDFIANESIVTTGAGRIIFKPVVKFTVHNTEYAKKSGTVFNDLDGNGIQDTEEPGLANWTIYMDQNLNGAFDEGEISVMTDSDGKYRFVGLDPATYMIREVVEPGWVQTWPLDGYYEETLEAGQISPDNNFGNTQE
jgi:hypothetical protein